MVVDPGERACEDFLCPFPYRSDASSHTEMTLDFGDRSGILIIKGRLGERWTEAISEASKRVDAPSHPRLYLWSAAGGCPPRTDDDRFLLDDGWSLCLERSISACLDGGTAQTRAV
jgi:hypothetical protein